jgi:hypothetical protein
MPNYFNDGFGRPEVDAKLSDLLVAPAVGTGHVSLNTVTSSLVLAVQEGVNTSFSATLTNNITANITATGLPAAGKVFSAEVEIAQPASGAATVVWFPGSTVKFANGVTSLPLSTTPNKIDRFSIKTRDSGATWFVDIIGLGY